MRNLIFVAREEGQPAGYIALRSEEGGAILRAGKWLPPVVVEEPESDAQELVRLVVTSKSPICRNFPFVRTRLWGSLGAVGSEAMQAQPIRILLVDDDVSFLHSLEALLTGEPWLEIVGKAANGEEALAAAARAEPDVAVIDVLMPTMSGIECAHLLQERYPKVRVILISGSIFEDRRPHPDERGTDAYLEKSEVPERLHATILALAAETTAAPPGRTNA